MNKTTLRQFIKDLMNRTDLTDSLIDSYMEISFQYIQRDLRLPNMERQTSFTGANAGGTESFLIPNDYLEAIAVIRKDSSGNDKVVNRKTIADFYNYDTSSTQNIYTRLRSSLLMRPVVAQNETFSMLYYGTLTFFASDSDEPALASFAPDLIAYQTCSYLCDYYVDERMQLFQQRADNAVQKLMAQNESEEMRGGLFQMSTPYAGSEY